IDTLETLLAAVESGAHFRYLFFWSHRPDRQGEIDRACLSQWWPASFQVEGNTYPSAEHYMMAEKARLFGDETIRKRILAASSPGEAKKLGRQVTGFNEAVWAAERFEIVAAGNRAKFGQNPELAVWLRSTTPRILVEASLQDCIWGIGLAESDPDAQNPRLWRGENLLGFALMQVRRELNPAR
ncbi:MAG: NADAR family protein, partial [Caldilineaceae bacterium]